MFENSLAQLAIVAAFVQKFVALVKPLYQKTEYQKYFDIALALGVSALLCVAWGVDIFIVAGLEFPSIPWLGGLFTGVIAGLGAGVLNDVLVLLEMWKNEKKADAALTAAVAIEMAEAVDTEPKG